MQNVIDLCNMKRAVDKSLESEDPSRKVGCIMVRFGLVVIAAGFNGYITSSAHDHGVFPRPLITQKQLADTFPELLQPPLKYEAIQHAEQRMFYKMAHLSRSLATIGADLGISPRDVHPLIGRKSTIYLNWVGCKNCTLLLVSIAPKRVVMLEPENWDEKRYGYFAANIQYMVNAGIDVQFAGRRIDAKDVDYYKKVKSWDDVKNGFDPKGVSSRALRALSFIRAQGAMTTLSI